jgi:hypothetical protein
MKVYITKKAHHKYNYLANWINQDTKAMTGQWFTTMKELKEYTASWGATYIIIKEG